MARIDVRHRDVQVVLELNEEEALHALGCLGHATGPGPQLYSELYDALRVAGYSHEFLDVASNAVKVLL